MIPKSTLSIKVAFLFVSQLVMAGFWLPAPFGSAKVEGFFGFQIFRRKFLNYFRSDFQVLAASDWSGLQRYGGFFRWCKLFEK
ncbi:hypothetical protein ACVWYF_001665 [Hymenobacter sp. UYAg731]